MPRHRQPGPPSRTLLSGVTARGGGSMTDWVGPRRTVAGPAIRPSPRTVDLGAQSHARSVCGTRRSPAVAVEVGRTAQVTEDSSANSVGPITIGPVGVGNEAHLFTVQNPGGDYANHDVIGYAAIGSGAIPGLPA